LAVDVCALYLADFDCLFWGIFRINSTLYNFPSTLSMAFLAVKYWDWRTFLDHHGGKLWMQMTENSCWMLSRTQGLKQCIRTPTSL